VDSPPNYLVLGPLAVRSASGPVALGGPRPKTLLCRLLLDPGRVVATDRLIDDLWDGRPPRSALNTLQSYVSMLRRGLGGPGLLAHRNVGYVLAIAPEAVDATVFERLVVAARAALHAGEPARALGLTERALALWRGPALADVATRPWARGEAARLEELRAVATEDRTEARLALGHHDAVLAELGPAAASPLRERQVGLVATALRQAGRADEALDALARTRALLADEMGLDPGPELTALEASIRAGQELVGRTTELAWLHGQWADVVVGARRLVVVEGEPGVGKSRLAAAFVHQVGAAVSRPADPAEPGVWLIDDLHLATPGTIDRVVRLLRERDTDVTDGLLILATGTAPLDLVADLRTEGLVDRRRLSGLTVDEVASLLAALGAGADPAAAAAVHRASGGNPALVEQMAGTVGARPQVDRLLGQVGPATVTTLSAAAAAAGPGDRFELDHLVVWTGADHGTLLDHLEGAAAAGLVVEHEADHWGFAHGAVARQLVSASASAGAGAGAAAT
jgi:DNA-binding SARP family transcriptional activator